VSVVRGLPDESWRQYAACKGEQADCFYPPVEGETREQRQLREKKAKQICSSCSVRLACLNYAIEQHETYGIWGGLNETERRRYARRRSPFAVNASSPAAV
jgi:WhiB family redox-sensing transcriptional regulator